MDDDSYTPGSFDPLGSAPEPFLPRAEQHAALQQWLERCAFDRCDPETQDILAGIGRSVEALLKMERPDLGLFLRQTEPPEGRIDSTCWTIFETSVVLGHSLAAPEGWSAQGKHPLYLKSCIRQASSPTPYVRKMIGRSVVSQLYQESLRPLRADGKLRTQNKVPLDSIGWTEDGTLPNLPMEELQKLPGYISLVSVVPEIWTGVPLEKLAEARKFAREEFERISQQKSRTLLVTLAARFLGKRVTSDEVLAACKVRDRSTPSSTLSDYLTSLSNESRFRDEVPGTRKALTRAFLEELGAMVRACAQKEQLFPSVEKEGPA